MLTLFTGTQVRSRDELVHTIAKEVGRITLGQLHPAASNMNVAELRGYLRSRAASNARSEVHNAVIEHRIPAARENDFAASVLDLAVHLMIRDLTSHPVVALPIPHVRMRAAA